MAGMFTASACVAPWLEPSSSTNPAAASATPNAARPRFFTEKRIAVVLLNSITRSVFELGLITGWPNLGLPAFAQLLDHRVTHRYECEPENRRGQHAANNGGADRMPAACPGTCCHQQRQGAEDEGEGSRQNRSQPKPSCFHCCLQDAGAALAQLLGELHDQDRVLRSQPDQHDHADL